MSSNFIGSQIAIITKSQCRYVGTIIGIDAQASSILLGNVKCFGTENRGGNFSNNQIAGTIVPIMQFANSDIEDLKIVNDDQLIDKSSNSIPAVSSPPPPLPQPAPIQKRLSIHDDPAIVSAVVSTTNKDLSMSSRLLYDLQHLNLSDEQSKKLPKTEESRLRTDSGEVGPSWSLLSSSHQQNSQSGTKSKFFDDFSLNNPDKFQSNHSQQRWPSNTHSTQTTRNQDYHYNEQEDNNNKFPIRQPYFSNNRYQNGNIQQQQQQQQQRYFYNNRRPQINNQQYRSTGNRETFNDNGNNYNDDFDFETSNRKFNKLTSEDEFKQQSESPNQFLHSNNDSDLTNEYEPMYNKKKSFFDSINLEDTSDIQTPMYNRSRNQDTFGNDRNQYQRNRGGGGYRRLNNNTNTNNYRQGNENFYYRQNNNGYNYRY